jgi:hypothetical protein
VPEVDDDQLAALHRLRAAFGPIEVVESFAMTKSLAMTQKLMGRGTGGGWRGARMADPRRMTPAEQGEAHALLVRAVTDPDGQPPARPWTT